MSIIKESQTPNRIEQLVKVAKELASNSMAPSSKRAYMTDWRMFLNFCDAHGLEPLPADSSTLVLWIAYLKERHNKVSSIVRTMTSINKVHICLGFESTHSPMVSDTIRGLRRTLGVAKEKTHAIRWEELCLMIQGIWAFDCQKSAIEKRDCAILALGWCGALRRSELTALNFADIEHEDRGMILDIRRSKTDQFGEGCKIAIPYLHSRFCPGKILKNWTDFLADKNIKRGALFRRLGMSGKLYSSAKIGKRLGPQSISLIVKRYAKFIGQTTSSISAHSLRRGFVTEAAARGIPERIIMRHTRHASIEVMREYIEAGQIWSESPLVLMSSELSSSTVQNLKL